MNLSINNINFNTPAFSARKAKTEPVAPISNYEISVMSTPKGDYFIRSSKDEACKTTEIAKATSYEKKLNARIKELTTLDTDNEIKLLNKDGSIVTLQRALTPREITAARALTFIYKNDKVKDFIDVIDMGADIQAAGRIVTLNNGAKNFKALTTPNEDGKCQIETEDGEIVLSRPLCALEAQTLVLMRNRMISYRNLQDFINMIDDYGLDISHAQAIAKSEAKINKFYSLVNSDDETNNLTPNQALAALDLDDEKLSSFRQILEYGLDEKSAAYLAKDNRRSAKFLLLITPNSDNKVEIPLLDESVLVLPRALTPTEANLAITEHFSNQKIYNQLSEFGEIHSTRRYQ